MRTSSACPVRLRFLFALGLSSLYALACALHKAASAGRELVKVDPRGTSQVCVCGAAVPKTLAQRWHARPVCGLSAPRDVVTAQVILERARVARSRHNVEDVVSCVPREAVALQATE